MNILLISGHGAGDPGCVATMKGVTYKEAEETIKVVDLLKPLLEPYAKVGVYDEARDAFRDAKAGTLAAKLKGWDYVLEIHFNACVGDYIGNGQTTGAEIFYPSRGRSSGAEDAIMRGLAALGLKNRGEQAGTFAVINTAHNMGCKANLLEVCFLDDADDMRIYTKSRQAVAQAIAGGVVSAFGLTESEDEVRYAYLKDIPNDWGARDMVDKLMTAGVIAGDGSDKTGNGDVIDLSQDMVRMLAFNYAAGVYDAALTAKGLRRHD